MSEPITRAEEWVRARAEVWQRHHQVGQLTRIRREARRASFPVVRVTCPGRDAVLVHAESNYDALTQAAKAWGAAWEEIRGAEVWRCETSGVLDGSGSGTAETQR